MNQDNVKQDELTGYGGISAGTERNYTNSELDIGRRICSNLKKKREFFEKLDNEKEQFKFRAEIRNCDNGIYNTDLFIASISNANSTTPEYIADRKNYFRDVATDQSGIVKQVCDNIIQSDKVANTTYDNNFKYAVNFLIADGFDRYEVTKAKKNASGTFDRLSAEGVSLISQKIQAPIKFFGVEKDKTDC